LTPIALNHLERVQVEALISRIASSKTLPTEVIDHIVAKTDGVPLYVEELTKMLITSHFLREEANRYELTEPLLTLAIPDTLQESLMARLDQLNMAKDIAQLGAVLGREFPYDMIQALSPMQEQPLREGLGQLVAAELLYQRGRPPRATYIFKHALIQDAAYASLLRSTRRHIHQQVAQLLESDFPDVVNAQPELVASHYTAGDGFQEAVAYWSRAGKQAAQGSANVEAIHHLQTGLEVLTSLPDTPERASQELDLWLALGPVLLATHGYAASEVTHAYTRAREICQLQGESPEQFAVLLNLWLISMSRSEHRTALELIEQCLELAQHVQNDV
jgi:predicted ATPase